MRTSQIIICIIGLIFCGIAIFVGPTVAVLIDRNAGMSLIFSSMFGACACCGGAFLLTPKKEEGK